MAAMGLHNIHHLQLGGADQRIPLTLETVALVPIRQIAREDPLHDDAV